MSEPKLVQAWDDSPAEAHANAQVQSAEDPRVIRHLHEYGLALQAGTRPPREELLAMFPDITQELSACLDGLEFIHHVAPQLGGAAGKAAEWSANQLSSLPLGDFRIVREIGRGGMGVVYEADQLSLGRRVALKVLPFASVLDSRQLQRFKNEAQAAASLHHTHIVPVYSVGCERGVHYYAMQYIEGQTLAEVIEELREESAERPARSAEQKRSQESGARSQEDVSNSPPLFASAPRSAPGHPRSGSVPRSTVLASLSTARTSNHRSFFHSVARLGVEVAEALDYAHQQGVVHRDIKPLNVILDEHGEPWIADFGLARVEAAGSLTITGDLLGTLRYMSPEQASAERAIVDHRSDIYSLGATLYELLTLEPAFAGNSRDELLRRIVSEEPRRPRRLNPSVPAELETIVLKTLAKQPQMRYATAQALADDLRRFLIDLPIKAKPPTAAQRLRKWSRRHKPLLASVSVSTLAILLLAVVGLAVSHVAITREQKRTAEALEDARTGRAAAAAQREQADANLRQALAAIDRILTGVANGEPGEEPTAEPGRRRLLEDALEFYATLLQQRAADPLLQRETSRMYQRVGNIHRQLGQPGPAEVAFRRGLAEFERLAGADPETPANRMGVAEVCTDLAGLLREIPGREHDTEDLCRRATEAWGRLVAAHPDVPTYQWHLARAHHELGYFLGGMKRFVEAEKAFQQALALMAGLAAATPDDVGLLHEEATFLNSLGLLLRQAGRPHEAEQAHRRALSLIEDEVNHGATVADHDNQLARGLNHLALALERSGRRTEAEPLLRRALDLRTALLNAAPSAAQTRAESALTFAALASLLARDQRAAEAEPLYQRAVEIEDRLVHDFPALPKHRGDLASILERQGRLLLGADRAPEAEPLLRRALALRDELVFERAGVEAYERELTHTRLLLSIACRRLGKTVEAQGLYDQALVWVEAHPDEDAELRALCGEAEEALRTE
ncbi:MAG TPA: serine/threonine-protein kinase [Pirellulales bacterium]|nr:serine/threonine-protein kinase [Pirellulales bacterium]